MYHMDFHVPSKLHTWAEEQWKTIDNHTSLNRGEVEKPLRVGLVLGTSWATKEWPQEKWYSLIKSLQYRANFVCLGGPKAVSYTHLSLEIRMLFIHSTLYVRITICINWLVRL